MKMKLISSFFLIFFLHFHQMLSDDKCKPNIYKTLHAKEYKIGDRILTPKLIYEGQCNCWITDKTEDSLKVIADFLIHNDSLITELGFFTRFEGSERYNLLYSERMAERIVEWLIKKGGVDSNQIIAKGYGESQPLFTEEDISRTEIVEEREQLKSCNRREEIKILKIIK